MKSNTVINDFLIRSFNVVQIGVLLLGFNNALANDGCWINIRLVPEPIHAFITAL